MSKTTLSALLPWAILVGLFLFLSGYGWGKRNSDRQIEELKGQTRGWQRIAMSKDCELMHGNFTPEGSCVRNGNLLFSTEDKP